METLQERKDIFAKNFNRIKGDIPAREIAYDLRIPTQTVSNWARGYSYPPMNKLQILADYFGCTISDLVDEHTSIGTRKITDDELKFALSGAENGISSRQLAEVKKYVRFIIDRDNGK